ncbi:hypothetical protein KSS87_012629, partial [Heliosperma pusillum]
FFLSLPIKLLPCSPFSLFYYSGVTPYFPLNLLFIERFKENVIWKAFSLTTVNAC